MPLDGCEPTETIQSGALTRPPNKAGALTNLAGRKELHRIINFCERLERSEAIERMNVLNKSSVIFHRLQPALADRAGRLR